MTDNDQHNQANRHRRDPNAPVEQQEHETHITALVLLSLATIIAIAIIFAVRQDTANLNPNTYDDSTSTQQMTGSQNDETNGYAVPVETVQTTDVSGLSGLPTDLPISEDAETIRNYSSSVGDTGTQRIYMYSTASTVSDLASAYKAWLKNSNFSITDSEQNDTNATIRSEQEGQRLILGISTTDDGNREVQVNYINESN